MEINNEYPAGGLPTWNISYHDMPCIDDSVIHGWRPKLESYIYGYNLEIKYLPVTADILYSVIHDTRPVNLSIRECNLGNMSYALPNTIRNLGLKDNKLTELNNLPAGLQLLDCSGNKIERLEGIPNSLSILICHNNPLRHLEIQNPITANLQELDCSKCNLTELPELPPSLQKLTCHGNTGLAKLPQIPAELVFLNCSLCSLTELPEFPEGSKLKVLKCISNELTALPLLPPMLESLECSYNKLIYLPSNLPDTLMDLNCSHNQLTNLPLNLSSLTKLDTLYCAANKLTWLPDLPTSLCEIDCSNNNLYIFPMQIPSGLTWLDCRHNPMLQWLPAMPSELGYIRLDTVPLPLDESEDFAEITPEIITYINNEHERLFRKWICDRLAVYKTELLERQLDITMNPDRISRLIRTGELGHLGTWYDSFS